MELVFYTFDVLVYFWLSLNWLQYLKFESNVILYTAANWVWRKAKHIEIMGLVNFLISWESQAVPRAPITQKSATNAMKKRKLH